MKSLYRRRRGILTVCMIAWAVAFVATHIPASKLPRLHAPDVMLHAGGYFVLSGLFLLTLTAYRVIRPYKLCLVTSTMILYATLDETTQTFVNRYATLEDWLANIAGAMLAVVTLEILFSFSPFRRIRREGTKNPR